MDDILAAGRKYLKHPRFRLLAAAAILSGVLSDAVASQVQSLDVTSESGHYKKAIQALHDGNLDRAYRLLTDDKNSLYTEIMDKVSPLAALRFKQKMDEEFDNARHREYK
jgi:outer membrane protein assembly factor BamD (BamD/ComL family)